MQAPHFYRICICMPGGVAEWRRMRQNGAVWIRVEQGGPGGPGWNRVEQGGAGWSRMEQRGKGGTGWTGATGWNRLEQGGASFYEYTYRAVFQSILSHNEAK